MHMRQTNVFLCSMPIIHANYGYSDGVPQISVLHQSLL